MLVIKARGGGEVYLHTCLLSIPVGIKWPASVPSHFSPGNTPATHLTLQRGVMSAVRHSENITCHGVTSTARHAALSLIRLYLDNIRRKCIRAALYVFMKELALLWCGRQFLQIIASFFSLLSKFGWYSFCSP